eukprot:4885334-Lingulodinium_polyedra.AAC.1
MCRMRKPWMCRRTNPKPLRKASTAMWMSVRSCSEVEEDKAHLRLLWQSWAAHPLATNSSVSSRRLASGPRLGPRPGE